MATTDILKFLNCFDANQNNIVEVPVRAKKRRLDHLSWDEKIQRKKLKNRVAAQTSRDRKKARIDQMEKTLSELCARNDALMSECEELKSVNERIHPSTERDSYTPSSGFALQRPDSSPPEDCPGLPSLPDLLDELDKDVDVVSLEQLAQSLLEDIARDLEMAAEEADHQESKIGGQRNAGKMVGKPSEKLESCGGVMLGVEKAKSLENDISQYLLLHHNYTKPGPEPKKIAPKSRMHNKKESKALRTTSKLKKIVPKGPLKTGAICLQRESIPSIVKCEPVVECSPVINLDASHESADVIYGTYDEATNCVTIVINEDGTCVTEADEIVLTPENTLTTNVQNDKFLCVSPSKEVNGGASPISTSGSDCGYESLDSPLSLDDEIWDQSVSELFPSLL
ncbi:hypothetical protein WA026_014916 [Henosepilachna vigintioctopunctata]|uniref:X-box-binding protein 1 n=1 Tax=Henosepilachna vigintioctopunctata TaxID=420089 RepID=A0AAW1V1L0_9CUCU